MRNTTDYFDGLQYQTPSELRSGPLFYRGCGTFRNNPEEWISSGAIHSASGAEPVFGEKEEFSLGEMTTFVSKNCKAPEAAARFLTVLTTQEGMKSYLNRGKLVAASK